jgi:hypothetical protein
MCNKKPYQFAKYQIHKILKHMSQTSKLKVITPNHSHIRVGLVCKRIWIRIRMKENKVIEKKKK